MERRRLQGMVHRYVEMREREREVRKTRQISDALFNIDVDRLKSNKSRERGTQVTQCTATDGGVSGSVREGIQRRSCDDGS